MLSIKRRQLSFVCFILICILLAGAAYLQMMDGLVPCPLCLLQRYAMALLGVLFLFSSLFRCRRFGASLYALGCFLMAALGAVFAGRQIWLQHFSSAQAADCGASLHYLIQTLPLRDALTHIFHSSANCAQVEWSFLGLGLVHYTLIAFCFFGIVALRQLISAGSD